MTDIEALRARMREAAEWALAEREMVANLPIGMPASDLNRFRDICTPANVKALDAYTTRLREDLDRVTRERDEARADAASWQAQAQRVAQDAVEFGTRAEAAEAALSEKTAERDGAYLTSQQAAQSYSNLMRVKDDIDAQRQAAEAALAKRDEEVERLLAAMDREEAYLHRMIDASEENGGIMHGDLEGAFHRIRDKDSDDAERAEALTKEPPHAG